MRSTRNKPKFIDDLGKMGSFKDFARMAGGAAESLGAVRGQVKSVVNGFLAEMDFVTRDEFERVEALAQKARERQIALEKRLEELEKHLGARTPQTAKTKKAKK